MYRRYKFKSKPKNLYGVFRLMFMLLFVAVLSFSFLFGSVPVSDTELSAAAQTEEEVTNVEEEEELIAGADEISEPYSAYPQSEDYIISSDQSAIPSDTNYAITPYKSPQIFSPSVTLDEKEGMVFKDDILNGLSTSGYSMLRGSGTSTVKDLPWPYEGTRRAYNKTVQTYFRILVDTGAVHWSIADYAFADCSKVTSYKLRHSCGVDGNGYIGAYAFHNATALNEFFMFMDGRFNTIRTHAFDGCENLYEVTVENAREGYSGTTTIGDYAFRNCKSLKGFLGVWVPKAGKVAAHHHETEHVPSSLRTLGRGAFQGCEALEDWFAQELLDTLQYRMNPVPAEVFQGCTSLTSVTVPYGYKTIDEAAFKGCTNLKTVYLPSSITEIKAGAFKDCVNLEHVYVTGTSNNFISANNAPNLVTIGGDSTYGGAFENCYKLIFDNSGASLSIPNNVRTIGTNAFNNVSRDISTKLNTITLNAALTSLGNGAFANLLHVKTLNYNSTTVANLNGQNSTFLKLGSSTDGVTVNVGANVTRIPGSLFYASVNYADNPKIKAVNFIATSHCELIGPCAFAYSNESLKNISMPASVKTYDTQAFYKSKFLESIDFGANVETIGVSAFELCTGLSEISLSNTCKYIKDRAFFGCEFTTAELGTGIITIGNSSFQNCKNLLSVATGDNCISIGTSAFEECVSLTDATLGSKCVTINKRAFYNCNSLVKFDSTSPMLEIIGDSAFQKCSSLPEINIAHTLTYLGTSAFEDCVSLRDINYCEDSAYKGVLETINARAFYNCRSLESIYIPISLTHSCTDSFKYCESLMLTTYYGTQEMWTSRITFDNGYANPLSGCRSADSKFCVNGLKVSLNTYDSGNTTFINDYVFFGYAGLSSILITPTVKTVGKFAFAYCTDLQSMTGFEGLEEFSESMFEGCSKLYAISIPANIKRLGKNCFKNCTGLNSIIIPNTVQEMHDGILFGCVNMQEIMIPYVGKSATSHDSHEGVLGYIFGYYIDGEQDPETDVDGNAVSATYQCTYNGKDYYYYLPETLKKVTITDGNVYGGKYWVPTSGFQNANVTSIVLPHKLSKFGDKSFMGCKNLVDVSVTLELNEIGSYAFADCSSLTSFLIPEAVTVINEGTFENCVSLRVTNLHEKITSLGHYAFRGCSSLETVTLFENVALLGRGVFANCTGLTSINFNATECRTDVSTEVSAEAALESPFYNAGKVNNGVYLCKLNIGVNALGIYAYTFSYLKASEVTFYNHSNCGLIGDFAFYSCVMKEVTNIPSQLKFIDSYAFAECSELETFEFPGSVTSISSYAFYHCQLLTEVTIPEPVTTIKEFAFAECTSLQRIYFNAANVTSSSSNIFFHSGGGANGDGSIELLVGNVVSQIPAYLFYVNDEERENGNASRLKTVYFVAGGVCRSIGAYAFANCIHLESVDMADTVTSFGDYAFYYCKVLRSIVIPSGTQTINSYVFAYSGLHSAAVPEGVSTIRDYAFFNCADLKSLSLPDSLVTLSGSHMFQFCSSLKSLRIPDLVTNIGFDPSPKSNNGVTAYYGMLFGCTSLESLTVPFIGQTPSSTTDYNSVLGYFFGYSTVLDNNVLQTFIKSDNSLGSYYYYIPFTLKNVTVTLGNRNKSINQYAFNNCKSIENATLGSGIISIGNYAFLGCSGLNTINIPASVISFGDYSFKDCRSPETTSVRSGIKVVYGGSISEWLGITFNNEYAAPMREHGQLWIDGEKVVELNIPDEIKEIKAYAFLGCDFQSPLGVGGIVTIPITVEKINRQAFYGCTGIATIKYNASECNETAGDMRAFEGAGNEDNNTLLIVGSNVLFVPQYLFRGARIEEVQFSSQTCTYIGEYAFADNEYLKRFEFPASITNVKAFAFDKDISETDVYYTGNVVQWTLINFNDSVSTDTDQRKGAQANPLCYGGNLYTGAILTGGSNGTLLRVLDTDASITRIEAYTFAGCTSLEIVRLNDGIVYIGDQAFYGCQNLHTVYISKDVVEICERVFGNCPSLENLSVGDGNTVYTSKANNGTTQINAVVEIESKRLIIGCKTSTIPNDGTVKIIGEYAFEFITSLTDMDIADAVEKIESSAFYGCTGLKTLTIGEGITTIENFAFYNCTGLQKINFNAVDCADFKANNYIFYRAGKESSSLEVVFGQKVKNVPAYIFYPVETTETAYAPGVTKVSFEQGCECKSIGEYAFIRCNVLKEVTLPNYIEEIGVHAFDSCSQLERIDLPATLLEIREYTFYNCTALTNVNAKNTLKRIDAHAFENCSSLTSAQFYLSEDADIEFIGLDAFSGTKIFENWDKHISDPDSNGSDTSVSSDVLIFKNKYILKARTGLTQLVMDDKVTLVASHVFEGFSNLSKVTYSPNLKYVNSYAFYNCLQLVSGDLSNTKLVEIGEYAYYNNQSLAGFKFPDKGTVKAIGDYAFLYCTNPQFISIDIPSSVVKLGLGSLAIRNLQSATLPFVGGSITADTASESTLFGYVFGKISNNECTEIVQYYSAEDSVTYYIPANLTKVTVTDPDKAAAQEGTWYVDSYSGAENFYYGAFYGYTWLEELILPDTILENIHESAFYNCSAITEMVVPDSVLKIGDYAFYGTKSLKEISLPFVGHSDDAEEEKAVLGYIFGYSEFDNSDNDTLMTAQYYKANTVGYYYIPATLTNVTITRGRGDSSIYYGSFSNCVNLKSIVYNYAGILRNEFSGVVVTVIDPYAFYYATSLEEVTIPVEVQRIGTYAFYNTISLKTINYNAANVSDAEGESFSSSSNEVFYRAGEESESGVKVAFGKQVVSIPKNLFNPQVGADGTAPKLTSVTFENGSALQSIGEYAFRACDDFAVIVLPDSLRAIGDYAFYGCSALQWTYLPSLKINANAELSSFAQLFSVMPYALDTTAQFDTLQIGTNSFVGCNTQMILIAANVTEYTNYYNKYYGASANKVNFNKVLNDTLRTNQYPLTYTVTATFWVLEYDSVFKEWVEQHTQDKRLYGQNVNLMQNEDFSWSLKGLPKVVEYYRVHSWRNTLLTDENSYDILSSTTNTKVLTNKPLYRVADIASDFTANGITVIDDAALNAYSFEDGDQVYYYAHEFEIIFTTVSKPADKENYTYNGVDRHTDFLNQIYSNTVDASGNVVAEGETWSELLELKELAHPYTKNSAIFTISRIDYTSVDGNTKLYQEFAYDNDAEVKDKALKDFITNTNNLTNAGTYELTLSIVREYWRIKYRWQDNVVNDGQNTYVVRAVVNPSKLQFGDIELSSKTKTFDGNTHINITYQASALTGTYQRDKSFVQYSAVANYDTPTAGINKRIYLDIKLIPSPENTSNPIYPGDSFLGGYVFDAENSPEGINDLRKLYYYNYYLSSSATSRYLITDQIILDGGVINKKSVSIDWEHKGNNPASIWTSEADRLTTPYTGTEKVPVGVVTDAVDGFPVNIAGIAFEHTVKVTDDDNITTEEVVDIDKCIKVDNTYVGTITLSDVVNYYIDAKINIEIVKAELDFNPVLTLLNAKGTNVGTESVSPNDNTVLIRGTSDEDNKPKNLNVLYTSSTLNDNAILSFPTSDAYGVAMSDAFIKGTFTWISSNDTTWQNGDSKLTVAPDDNRHQYSWRFDLDPEFANEFLAAKLEGTISIAVDNIDLERLGYVENEATYPEIIYAIYTANMINDFVYIYGYNNDGSDAFGTVLNDGCTFALDTTSDNKQQFIVGENTVVVTYEFTDANEVHQVLTLPIKINAEPFKIAKPIDESAIYDGSAHGYEVKNVSISSTNVPAKDVSPERPVMMSNDRLTEYYNTLVYEVSSANAFTKVRVDGNGAVMKDEEGNLIGYDVSLKITDLFGKQDTNGKYYYQWQGLENDDRDITVSFVINPQVVEITGVTSVPKIYDGTTSISDGTQDENGNANTVIRVSTNSLSGVVGNDDLKFDFDLTFSSFDSPNVGSRTIETTVILSGESSTNYILQNNDGIYVVTGTIIPKPVELEWVGADPFTFTYNGREQAPKAKVKESQLCVNVGAEVTVDECAVSVTNVGVHANTYISALTLDNPNYTFKKMSAYGSNYDVTEGANGVNSATVTYTIGRLTLMSDPVVVINRYGMYEDLSGNKLYAKMSTLRQVTLRMPDECYVDGEPIIQGSYHFYSSVDDLLEAGIDREYGCYFTLDDVQSQADCVGYAEGTNLKVKLTIYTAVDEPQAQSFTFDGDFHSYFIEETARYGFSLDAEHSTNQFIDANSDGYDIMLKIGENYSAAYAWGPDLNVDTEGRLIVKFYGFPAALPAFTPIVTFVNTGNPDEIYASNTLEENAILELPETIFANALFTKYIANKQLYDHSYYLSTYDICDFKWVEGQTLSSSVRSYNYTVIFKGVWIQNFIAWSSYNAVDVTVTDVAPDHLIAINNNANLIYTSNGLEGLKEWLTVYLVYNDGSRRNTALSGDEYTLSLSNGGTLVSGEDSQYLNDVKVTYVADATVAPATVQVIVQYTVLKTPEREQVITYDGKPHIFIISGYADEENTILASSAYALCDANGVYCTESTMPYVVNANEVNTFYLRVLAGYAWDTDIDPTGSGIISVNLKIEKADLGFDAVAKLRRTPHLYVDISNLNDNVRLYVPTELSYITGTFEWTCDTNITSVESGKTYSWRFTLDPVCQGNFNQISFTNASELKAYYPIATPADQVMKYTGGDLYYDTDKTGTTHITTSGGVELTFDNRYIFERANLALTYKNVGVYEFMIRIKDDKFAWDSYADEFAVTGSDVGVVPVKFTIVPAVLKFDITIDEKEYDGLTSTGSALSYKYTAEYGDRTETEMTVSQLTDLAHIVMTGTYQDSYYGANDAKNVGSNKLVIVRVSIADDTYGNYALYNNTSRFNFTNCVITPRVVTLAWSKRDFTDHEYKKVGLVPVEPVQIGENSVIPLTYNGEEQKPYATVTNIAGTDICYVLVSTATPCINVNLETEPYEATLALTNTNYKLADADKTVKFNIEKRLLEFYPVIKFIDENNTEFNRLYLTNPLSYVKLLTPEFGGFKGEFTWKAGDGFDPDGFVFNDYGTKTVYWTFTLDSSVAANFYINPTVDEDTPAVVNDGDEAQTEMTFSCNSEVTVYIAISLPKNNTVQYDREGHEYAFVSDETPSFYYTLPEHLNCPDDSCTDETHVACPANPSVTYVLQPFDEDHIEHTAIADYVHYAKFTVNGDIGSDEAVMSQFYAWAPYDSEKVPTVEQAVEESDKTVNYAEVKLHITKIKIDIENYVKHKILTDLGLLLYSNDLYTDTELYLDLSTYSSSVAGLTDEEIDAIDASEAEKAGNTAGSGGASAVAAPLSDGDEEEEVLPTLAYEAYLVLNSGAIAWEEKQELKYIDSEKVTDDTGTYTVNKCTWVFTPTAEYADIYDVVTGEIELKVYAKDVAKIEVDYIQGIDETNVSTDLSGNPVLEVYSNHTLGDLKSFIKVKAYFAGNEYAGILTSSSYSLHSTHYSDESIKLSSQFSGNEQIFVEYTNAAGAKVETSFWIKVLKTPLAKPDNQVYTYEYNTSYSFVIEDTGAAYQGYSVVNPQTYTQADEYEIKLVVDHNEFYWADDPEADFMYVTLTIEKATLDLSAIATVHGQNAANSGTLYESSNLYNHTSIKLDLPDEIDLPDIFNSEELAVISNGTIVWDADQSLVVGTNSYNWTFTPSAAYFQNYSRVTGTLDLYVVALEVVDFAVVRYSTDPIYDTNKASDLHDWINVYEVYNSTEYGNLIPYPNYSLEGPYYYDTELLTIGSNIISVKYAPFYDPNDPATVKHFTVNVLKDTDADKFAIVVPDNQVYRYNGEPHSFIPTSTHYQIIGENSFTLANEAGYEITLRLFAGYYWATTDDSGNYVKVTPESLTITVKLIIERVTLTLSGIFADPKVYDGNTTVNTLHYTQSGLGVLDSTDYSVFYNDYVVYSATARFLDPNAGTGKDIKLNVTLSGADAANYKIDANSLLIKGDIIPKTLNTVIWSSTPIIFNGFEQMPTGTIPSSDLIGNDTCDVKVTKGGIYAGDYTVGASDMQLTNTNYKLADTLSITFTIEKASLKDIKPDQKIVDTKVGILYANGWYNLSNVELSLSSEDYKFTGIFYWVETEWMGDSKFNLDFEEGDPHPGENIFHWRFSPTYPAMSLLDPSTAMNDAEKALYMASFNLRELEITFMEKDSLGDMVEVTKLMNVVVFYSGDVPEAAHIDYAAETVIIWQGANDLRDSVDNVYNGEDQCFAPKFASSSDELAYELYNSTRYPAWHKDAGEYDVKLVIKDAYKAQYYTWSEDDWLNGRVNSDGIATVKFVINKAKVAVSGITAVNKVYDGTTDTVPNQLNMSGITYTVQGKNNDGLYNNDTVAVTVKGTYNEKDVLKAKIINLTFVLTSDNYELDEKKSQKAIEGFITPRPTSVSWGITSFTYTSYPQKPKAEAQNLVKGDTCNVSVRTDEEAINVSPDPYVAHAYAIDNSNYSLNGEYSTEFYITKATPKFDPIITIIGTKGSKLYTTSNIYANADLSMPSVIGLKNSEVTLNGITGKLQWITGQVLIPGTRHYQWSFTPDDTNNFESIVSVSNLTVEPIIVTDIEAHVTSSRTIYITNSVDDVRNFITVTIYHNDGNLAGTTTDYTLHNADDDNTLVKGINTMTCVYTLRSGVSCEFDITVYDRSAFTPITVPKTQSVVYDGNEHSFARVEGQAGEGIHYTILSDNVYTTANEEGYSVRLKADEGYCWYDYDRDVDEVIVKFIINRAEYDFTPYIAIHGSNPASPYSLYTSSSLYENVTITAEGGTIVWAPNQILIAGLLPYYFTFTPEDTINYKISKASFDLSVEKVELKSLMVEVTSRENIYTTNSVGDLKNWLDVFAIYSDGTYSVVTDYTLLTGASVGSATMFTNKLVEGSNTVLVSYNTVSAETKLDVLGVSNNLLLYLLIGGGILLLLLIVAAVLAILYCTSFKFKLDHSDNETRVNCREIENEFMNQEFVESKVKWPNEQFTIGTETVAYLMFRGKQLCLAMNIPEDIAGYYADVIELTPYKSVNTVTELNSEATIEVLKTVINKVLTEHLYEGMNGSGSTDTLIDGE